MIGISENFFVGSKFDLNQFSLEDDAIVHATQTIHYKIMSWDRKYNKAKKDHPNYIVWENANRLSLNWVDGAAHLYNWSGPETFIKVLNFIDKWINNRRVFVLCDLGMSRSPTLGLIYLAKRQKLIPNDSFASARLEFRKIYPMYQPKGIADYVSQHWDEIS